MELKQLDLKKDNFMANNHKYIILTGIPLSRYTMHQQITPKLTFGVDFTTLFNNLKKAFELNNTGKKIGDVGVILHNILNGLQEIQNEDRHDAALEICTLFIVREDENIGEYSKELAKQKIDDWGKEGYDVNGFFHLALVSIQGFRQTFGEFITKSQAS